MLGAVTTTVLAGSSLTSVTETLKSSSPSTELSLLVSTLKHLVTLASTRLPAENTMFWSWGDTKSSSFTARRITRGTCYCFPLNFFVCLPAEPSVILSPTSTLNPSVREFWLSRVTQISPDSPSSMGELSRSFTLASRKVTRWNIVFGTKHFASHVRRPVFQLRLVQNWLQGHWCPMMLRLCQHWSYESPPDWCRLWWLC